MPMYWTFKCLLGCIYTVYYIVHIVFLVLNWLSNLEFRLPKKGDQVARIGVMGGGLGNSGNARKKTFFFNWPLPLSPSSQSLHIIIDPTWLGLPCLLFHPSLTCYVTCDMGHAMQCQPCHIVPLHLSPSPASVLLYPPLPTTDRKMDGW